MAGPKRRLHATIATLHHKYGPRSLRKAADLVGHTIPPHISTSFPALDAITGCRGIPLGAITLLTGHTTSGKLTLAYKLLAYAQRPARASHRDLVAILDLTHSTDPDYLARAKVDLDHLLIVRPTTSPQTLDVLLDLVRTRDLRAVLLDSVADLRADREIARVLPVVLGQIHHLLRPANCALICVDEPSPPWQRWLNVGRSAPVRQSAALHIEMQHESWIVHDQELAGYRARARVLKSRWAHGFPSAPVEIHFNDVIQARPTW